MKAVTFISIWIVLVVVKPAIADGFPPAPVDPSDHRECQELYAQYEIIAKPYKDESNRLYRLAADLSINSGNMSLPSDFRQWRESAAMQGEADRILTIGRDERWKCDHAVDARLRYLRERADPTKPVNTESGALDTVLHPIDSVGAKLDSLLHNAGVDSKSNDTFSPIRQDKNFDQIWSSLEALRSNGLLGNQSAAVISGTAFAGIKKVLDLALVAIDQISNDWGPDSSSRVSGSNVESNARSSGTVENQDKALEAEMKELNAALQESFNDPSFKNSLKAPKGVEVHIESGTSGGLNINDLINGLNMISQGVQAARGGGASAGNYGTTSGSASTCEAMNQNIHNKYDSKLAELEQKANSVNVSTFNQWGCQLYSVAAQMRGEIVQYAQRCRPEKVNITHAEYQQAILARDSTCARKN